MASWAWVMPRSARVPTESIAIIFGALSGGCLLTIAIRRRVPLWGGLLSPRIRVELDTTDRRLALGTLVSFALCLGALILAAVWRRHHAVGRETLEEQQEARSRLTVRTGWPKSRIEAKKPDARDRVGPQRR